MSDFEPLKPRNLGHFEDANIKRDIDWMALCGTLAESHMQFIHFVRKFLPQNATVQEIGENLQGEIARVLSTIAFEKSKK